VFWFALIPAYLSVAVLLFAVNELPFNHRHSERWIPIRRRDLADLPSTYWRVMVIACLLSLARFSPAFLVLKAHATGIDTALVPVVLGLMYLVFSLAAYPFGVLSDRYDRRLQLGIGTSVLITADIVLASATTIPLVMFGAALWGLQLGATQGVLGAIIADAAPDHLRGTALVSTTSQAA
jgi:MFS family permease